MLTNVDRLHAHMDRHNLAAVVARSGQNFTYLSGLAYPGTLARHLDLPDSTRALKLQDDLDSIEIGKLADLMVVDRDDLSVSGANMRETRSVSPSSTARLQAMPAC
jgi:hypothetical protein